MIRKKYPPEATIRDLYEIDNGYYDPIFGSVELPKPEGEPEVLVLSSGKTEIPVYRKLQKAGIPFAAGILYPGESDYQLARLLASGIISEEPYEPISDETYPKTLEDMGRMRKSDQCGSESWKYEPKDGGTASDCGEKDVGFYLIIMAAFPVLNN